MATTQNLVDLLRQLVGDTSANWLSDSLAVALLNAAQDEICSQIEVFTLRDGLQFTNLNPYVNLPSDLLRIWDIVYYDGRPIWSKDLLEFSDDPYYFALSQNGSAIYAAIETVPKSNLLRLWLAPTPTTAEPSTTINQIGGIGSTDTDITITATTKFGPYGMVLIESEKIIYTKLDKTNSKLSQCVRGVNGTTAAAHANGLTVEQYGLFIRYAKTLTALDAAVMGATAEWPHQHRMKLCHFAAWLYYSGKEDHAKAMFHINMARLGIAYQKQEMQSPHRQPRYTRTRTTSLTMGRPAGLWGRWPR